MKKVTSITLHRTEEGQRISYTYSVIEDMAVASDNNRGVIMLIDENVDVNAVYGFVYKIAEKRFMPGANLINITSATMVNSGSIQKIAYTYSLINPAEFRAVEENKRDTILIPDTAETKEILGHIEALFALIETQIAGE